MIHRTLSSILLCLTLTPSHSYNMLKKATTKISLSTLTGAACAVAYWSQNQEDNEQKKATIHRIESTKTSHENLLTGYDKHNAMVGFVMYSVPRMYPSQGIIQRLFINAPHRRKGNGELLLKTCCEKLAEEKCTHVLLYVDPENTAALTLYNKNGFGPHTSVVLPHLNYAKKL